MSSTYFPPEYLANQFNCSRCGVYAKQYWGNIVSQYRTKPVNGLAIPTLKRNANAYNGQNLPDNYVVSRCDSCKENVIWIDEKIIYPRTIIVEQPNLDLPTEIQNLYLESANILNDSPRAAAALLRLALQLLLEELGGKGKSIDADIKTIVASGIDPQVQKAMDIVRVFGNNGAHPGEIQIEEDPELVKKMFELINFIATKMITSQKEIDSLFDGLPDGAKEAINKRDSQEKNNA